MNSFRIVLLTTVVAALIYCESALAQDGSRQPDPVIGSWKINIEASLAAGWTLPENVAGLSEEYRLIEGDRIELTDTVTNMDGSEDVSILTWSVYGGVAELKGDQSGQSWIETLISPGTWLVTYLMDGVQIRTMEKIVSSDGNTLYQTRRGFNSEGQAWEAVTVLDRQ